MKYINLDIDVLRSEAYLGAEPVERATWLNLMAWCASQENGGVVEGAKEWGERKWMQICGITKEEATLVSTLYQFNDNGDLVVNLYPTKQEATMKAKREVAKTNGAKGGRPKKKPSSETKEKPTLETDNKPTSESVKKSKVKKGKEKEEEGREHVALPPTLDDVINLAISFFPKLDPDWVKSTARSFHGHFEMEHWTMANGRSLLPDKWKPRLQRWLEDNYRNEANPQKLERPADDEPVQLGGRQARDEIDLRETNN